MKPTLILALVLLTACNDATRPADPSRPLFQTALETEYTIEDLGGFGGTWNVAEGINEQGQIIGSSSTTSGMHGFLWEQGSLQDLGTFTVEGINNQGQIIGTIYTPTNETHAGLWENGVVTDLGTLGGWRSTPTAINDAGQITGQSTLPNGEIRAFLWANGVMSDLGTLGGTRSFPAGLNNLGQVAGTASTETGAFHVFRWEQGQMLDVGQLDNVTSVAGAVNGLGHIIGTASNSPGEQRAFYWNGTMREIPPEFGYQETAVIGLNDRGDVIGEWRHPGLPQSFLWRDGVSIPLGVPHGPPVLPYDISETGQIVGQYTAASGASHAFTWRDGILTDLHPSDPAFTSSRAMAVNENGWIVGSASVGMTLYAALWRPVTSPPVAIRLP